MELYIRSQDRMRLVPNPNLYVAESEDVTYIGDTMVGHIGKYKTKERALEILDEIQNVIYMSKLFNANVNAFKLSLEDLKMSEDEMNNLLKKISVYEMPQE